MGNDRRYGRQSIQGEFTPTVELLHSARSHAFVFKFTDGSVFFFIGGESESEMQVNCENE